MTADEQRPTPPLTEEELARIEDVAALLHDQRFLSPEEEVVRDDVPRLIADLRAKDAEVALYAEEVQAERSAANTLRIRNGELRAELEGLLELARSNRVEADAMGEIARKWEAEVERLRAERFIACPAEGCTAPHYHGATRPLTQR